MWGAWCRIGVKPGTYAGVLLQGRLEVTRDQGERLELKAGAQAF